MTWLAIYFKPSESEYDPPDWELHGWETDADNPEQAIEILEVRPDVPYRMFLVEVISSAELPMWQRAQFFRHEVKIHR
jgi:hypothetical protein